MRRGLLLVLLLAARPAWAADVAMDVAPTTLRLFPGRAQLFTVTNHGDRAVTVQIEAEDWRQQDNRDVLTPSDTLFVSPPLAQIAPGARQSVRVMARPSSTAEAQYRLVVSELPDAAQAGGAVQVLLQFRVPVFAAPVPGAPHLQWQARREGGKLHITVHNLGSAAVKLTSLKLDDAPLDESLVYVLPGTAHDFLPLASDALHLTAQDSLSGHAVSADLPAP